MSVEFLHAMVRVTDIDAALKFYRRRPRARRAHAL